MDGLLSHRYLNWALLLTLVLMWGTSFMVTALALEGFTPTAVTHIRLGVGAAVLLGICYIKGYRLPLTLRAWGVFFILGMMGNAIPFMLISWGQQEVASGTAGTLMAIMPMMTILIAHYLLPDEPLNRFKIAGVIVGFSGVALLLRADIALSASLWHELAILIAACCYALNAVLARKLSSFHPLVGSAGMLTAAFIMTTPLFLSESLAYSQILQQTGIIAALWLGFIPTAIASLIFFVVVERAGPGFLANINFMIPVVAFFTGAVVLNEPISLNSFAALVIILAGIVLTRRTVQEKP